jgi:riboflavin kinase/FMN adenylyltransferase
MEVVQGVQKLTRSLRHPVVTIGNFDGVHLGHQQIIRLAVEKARARGGTAIAYTFRPHPQVALRPEAQLQLLSTYDEKLEILGQLGIDVVIEEPFSREFSNTPPEEFFSDVLLHRLSTEAIVVGYDFAFGAQRQGHLQFLENFCKSSGVELTVVQPQRIGDEVVSSSKIRQYLKSGDPSGAARLMGRYFSYRGAVLKGDARGRKIGFPTANLKLENKLALPLGVYATLSICESAFPGQVIPSVTNIGVRPTFQSQDGGALPILIETHLLDVTGDLYGNTLEVRFVERLRDEMKFSGIDELKAQIQRDIEAARQLPALSKR